MVTPLGKGLESLIPPKPEAPAEPEALDVLHHQAGMQEPVYRFHEASLAARPAAAPREALRQKTAPAAGPPPEPRSGNEAHLATAKASPPRARDSIFWIELSKIEPNPYQPRRTFAAEELTSLANSIREHGILQPLLVTKVAIDRPGGLGVKYQLIAGERRWRAAKLAGLREVPVIVRLAETPEREKLELALIENVQREDLNPLERAQAFGRLVDDFGLMQREIAERIGKSREMVTNALRLLKLPEEIRSALLSNAITEGHARSLLALEENPGEQRKLFGQIRTANLSVRETELAVRAAAGLPLMRQRRPRRGGLDPDARELERRLEELFGTRVKLTKKGEQGKIVVEFYSAEELEGILNRIAKPGTATEL